MVSRKAQEIFSILEVIEERQARMEEKLDQIIESQRNKIASKGKKE